jgi:hypothetical protein
MKTVIECELRGLVTICPVCGHLPPDYCGKSAIVEALDAIGSTEGAPVQSATEEPASAPPKVTRGPRVKL